MALNPPFEPIVNCHPVLSPSAFGEVTDVASNRDSHEINKAPMGNGAGHRAVRSPHCSDALFDIIGKMLIELIKQEAVACRVPEDHADLDHFCGSQLDDITVNIDCMELRWRSQLGFVFANVRMRVVV